MVAWRAALFITSERLESWGTTERAREARRRPRFGVAWGRARTLGATMSTASPVTEGRPRGAAGGWLPATLARRLVTWLLNELDQDRERWILWLPVAFGAGIACYFALPSEPPVWLALFGSRAKRFICSRVHWVSVMPFPGLYIRTFSTAC